MTTSPHFAFLPLLHELSLRIMRSRSVPLTDVTELLEQLRHATASHDSLREWITLMPTAEPILTRSLTTAALTSWMFQHLPMPLLIWQEVGAAALFMDLGLLTTSLSERRRQTTLDTSPDDAALVHCRHADVGAALISSVEGMPGSVRRIIRHHHERLNGTGTPRRLVANELHPADRLLALVARTIAGLSELTQHLVDTTEYPRNFSVQINITAAQLVDETLAGDWDRTLVEPVLNALASVADLSSSVAQPNAATMYRIDRHSHGVRRPRVQRPIDDTTRPMGGKSGERVLHHTSMQLGGPHFRLSEQPFVRRPYAIEPNLPNREDRATR